jgi:hypothetical protein
MNGLRTWCFPAALICLSSAPALADDYGCPPITEPIFHPKGSVTVIGEVRPPRWGDFKQPPEKGVFATYWWITRLAVPGHAPSRVPPRFSVMSTITSVTATGDAYGEGGFLENQTVSIMVVQKRRDGYADYTVVTGRTCSKLDVSHPSY